MLNLKLRDKIQNTISIKQGTSMMDVAECDTKVKWKWAGLITQMYDQLKDS